jgi:hypothetical protein
MSAGTATFSSSKALSGTHFTQRLPMTDTPTNDPTALSREMLTQWERSMNELLTQHMSTAEFSKHMNESMKSTAEGMKALSKLLAPVSPATKDDIAQLSTRLHDLEEQVARAISLLESLVPTATALPPKHPVARTRRFTPAEPKDP